jgi:hypothetical protein
MYIPSEILAQNKVADRNPRPVPIYARPLIPMLKWYTCEKRAGRELLKIVLVVLGKYDITWESSKHQIVDT